jgi:predicted SAM-dependent methyltransferase
MTAVGIDLAPAETLEEATSREWFTVTPLKLDIGAGAEPRGEDFVTLDQFAPAHIKAPMWAIPLPDASVDEIWSSHALEHVACAKVSQTLKEWLRVLKPGARAIVQVPNFDYVARYWFTGTDRAWAEQMVFGTQAHDGEFHKAAYTAATIKADMEAAGFTVERVEYRWSHNQETLQAVATKP